MSIDVLQHKLQGIADGLDGVMSLCVEVDGQTVTVGPQDRFSAASTIKVPIMMAAFMQAQRGVLDLNQIILVPERERVGGSGVVSRLSQGVALPLIDLVTLMIIVSDNTATNLCIDAVGIVAINEYLAMAGCKDTLLGRRLMDYEARRQGRDNFASAQDMVVIFRDLWCGTTLDSVYRQTALDILFDQQFRDKLPRRIPHDGDRVRVAHKTGELQHIEHDTGILVVDGKPAFIAALTRDLAEPAAGRVAIGEVGLAVYKYMEGAL